MLKVAAFLLRPIKCTATERHPEAVASELVGWVELGITVTVHLTRFEQKELGSEIISNGGMYVVARSIDDVQGAGL